jgi:hypothetical protein
MVSPKMSELKLHFKADYAPLMKDAIIGAKPEAAKFAGTKWREDAANPEEIRMVVPLKEAGAWIHLLEALSEQEREESPERADGFEYIADIFQEESERLLGYTPEETEMGEEAEVSSCGSNPVGGGGGGGRKFWKGM